MGRGGAGKGGLKGQRQQPRAARWVCMWGEGQGKVTEEGGLFLLEVVGAPHRGLPSQRTPQASETWLGPSEEASREVWCTEYFLPRFPEEIKYPGDFSDRWASTSLSPCSLFSNFRQPGSLNQARIPGLLLGLELLEPAGFQYLGRPAAWCGWANTGLRVSPWLQVPALSPPRWLI